MKNQSLDFIIFGISGDLSKRYLLPALAELNTKNKLTQKLSIIGITRQNNLDIKDLIQNVRNKKGLEKILQITNIENLEKKLNKNNQRIFYLSIPSFESKKIISILKEKRLLRNNKDKILFEKPFGHDLNSAKKLFTHLETKFNWQSVYLVDHYLTKKIVEKLIDFRTKQNKNWSNQTIESIDIIASEKIGIENRSKFYEKTGALRDFMQSHLLLLLATTIMDMPKNLKDVPTKRLQALQNLMVIKHQTKRGQYLGYRNEVKNQNSLIETFASITLKSKNPKWHGVKMTLATGKNLDRKDTLIKIQFKDTKKTKIFRENHKRFRNSHIKVLTMALNANKSFFSSKEEAMQGWKIIGRLAKEWHASPIGLFVYKKNIAIEKL